MMYGDMDSFVRKLKEMGYQDVRLISTAEVTFMTGKEARRLMLTGFRASGRPEMVFTIW